MIPPPRPVLRRDHDSDVVTHRPEKIPVHDYNRIQAAARHARKLYPGVVGEVLADELVCYAEMGWLARKSSKVQRLVHELTTARLPDNVA